MQVQSIRIKSLRFLKGCSAGLDEKTVVVELDLTMANHNLEKTELLWQRCVDRFGKADPLYGVSANMWPGHFIRDDDPDEPIGPSLAKLKFARWVLALCVALQQWARDPVWQGRILSADDSVLRLAIPWRRQNVLTESLQWAIRLLVIWSWHENDLANSQVQQYETQVTEWLKKLQPDGVAPNTLRFARVACKRRIPVEQTLGYLQLGWGSEAHRLDSSFTGKTSNIAARNARNKFQTTQLLARAGLPVPTGALTSQVEQAIQVARKLGWPVVIKPSNQDQGTAVVPGIRDESVLLTAFDVAAKYSPGAVIVEKHIPGDDHRILVVNGEMLVATRRIPGGVIGDGKQTVIELVNSLNADPRRGTSKRSMLIRLALDDEALACLTEQQLSTDSIPDDGRFVRLRRTANISTGGTAEDVTASVHPDNRLLAERTARIIGLDIAGVDFLCTDISHSWFEVGGAICEVNAQPGFRVHWLGDPERDINAEVLDRLTNGRELRIPTAAITGTNGKTTVSMMLHHIWLEAGKKSGVTTTAGTWIGRDLVSRENLSGLPGAKLILSDPAVEVAVLEMPRKGLIIFGHACDRYDVSALLNVQDDHIGADGIETLDQMAELKAEVLERAVHAVIVNAEDVRCLGVRSRAHCRRHILVSRDPSISSIEEHLASGGEAVFLKTWQSQQWIVLAHGTEEQLLMPVHEIPATMNGLLQFNEMNALFAVALAWAHGIDQLTVRTALAGFRNSTEQHPGRYNFIEGLPFEVMIDFAHNPDGVNGLIEVVKQLPAARKRWLVNMMVGNRSKRHLEDLLSATVPLFDQFVLSARQELVRKSKDWESENPMKTMLDHGCQYLINKGVDQESVQVCENPEDAMRTALAQAQPGDQVIMLVKPWVALNVIDQWRGSMSRDTQSLSL